MPEERDVPQTQEPTIVDRLATEMGIFQQLVGQLDPAFHALEKELSSGNDYVAHIAALLKHQKQINAEVASQLITFGLVTADRQRRKSYLNQPQDSTE